MRVSGSAVRQHLRQVLRLLRERHLLLQQITRPGILRVSWFHFRFPRVGYLWIVVDRITSAPGCSALSSSLCGKFVMALPHQERHPVTFRGMLRRKVR